MESNSKSAVAMVTASGSKKGPMKHKFGRIEIHPAENGYTLKHHPAMEESKKKDSDGYPRYMPPPDPTEHVFSGPNAGPEMHAHMATLGIKMAGEGKATGAKDDKGKSGKMPASDTKGEKEADDENEDE